MLLQTFHQGDITFRFLWATVWVRPPLPVPRRSKPCIACSGFLCACTAASDAPSANAPRRGAHGASEPSSRNHRGPGHIESGTGRIYNPPLRRRTGDGAVDGLPRTRGLAGRCGHRPLRGGIIKPRRKSGAGPGGHTGRPYEKTGRRVCRGGFYIRPCAPVCRMHHRRPHSVGADAHIGPPGIDIKSAIAERTARRGAHCASGTGCDIHRAWSMHPVLGGYIIRPYGVDGGRCGRRTALHPEPGGPMWASAPTEETIEPRWKSGAGPGGHIGRSRQVFVHLSGLPLF